MTAGVILGDRGLLGQPIDPWLEGLSVLHETSRGLFGVGEEAFGGVFHRGALMSLIP
jgi:hypothetical protein